MEIGGPNEATDVKIGQDTGPDVRISDPEWNRKFKLIQHQLVLLIQANQCKQGHMSIHEDGKMKDCILPKCKIMKNFLNHITKCQSGKNCSVPHCSMSKLIINHWDHCFADDCPLCVPIKQANKNWIFWTNFVQVPLIQPNNQPNLSPSEIRRIYDDLEIQCPTSSVLLPLQDICRMLECLDMTDPSGNLDNLAPASSCWTSNCVFLPLNSDPNTIGIAIRRHRQLDVHPLQLPLPLLPIFNSSSICKHFLD